MLKKYIYIAFIFYSFCSLAQSEVTLYSKKQKIHPRINIPLHADRNLNKAALEFNKNFKAVTGKYLSIEKSNKLDTNDDYILLRVNPTQNKSYCFYKNGKNITIQGTTVQNLIYGIHDFFKRYTNLTIEEKKNYIKKYERTTEIKIPNEFSICSSPDFIYREPYFSSNFNPDFRAWNKTNHLELEWGIWGHNLSKTLKNVTLPTSSYAKVNGRREKRQYCFTDDVLFRHINEKIKNTYNGDHGLNKYMILPNDNKFVCTCTTCKAVGNTKTDASPAVFTFLNKLAKQHKHLSFFTTIYVSIKEVPKFKIASNVGVFYSTIDIQNGIPIKDTKYYKKFETDIKKWKNYLDKVYVWEYAVNFDNYFDIYPSLKVIQKNLNLYKKLGVNGVFIHGSEYDYSGFQDVKATLLAKLLWNTTINLDVEINKYFLGQYPEKLANALSNYYSFISDSFLINKQELSIYSGVNKSIKKYLDPKMFFGFYNEFDTHTQAHKYDKNYLKIATALTFLKLEIMRSYGIGTFGFASLNRNKEIIVKNETALLLDKLTVYSKTSRLKVYNEEQYKIEEYIDSWRKTIYKYHKRKHYFYKKPFKIISKLDEDYTNTKILNDGAFGLKDYNTNWHICSTDNLVLKIDKNKIKDSKKITLSFLQDIKHKIFYPRSIELIGTNNKIIKTKNLSSDKTSLSIKEVTLILPTLLENEQLPDSFIVRIRRAKKTGKNALACDEIIFN